MNQKKKELLDAITKESPFVKLKSKAKETKTCVMCIAPNMNFKDEISKKEYEISNLCQNCQDKIFG